MEKTTQPIAGGGCLVTIMIALPPDAQRIKKVSGTLYKAALKTIYGYHSGTLSEPRSSSTTVHTVDKIRLDLQGILAYFE